MRQLTYTGQNDSKTWVIKWRPAFIFQLKLDCLDRNIFRENFVENDQNLADFIISIFLFIKRIFLYSIIYSLSGLSSLTDSMRWLQSFRFMLHALKACTYFFLTLKRTRVPPKCKWSLNLPWSVKLVRRHLIERRFTDHDN